jgi:uncharacterized membrane protein
VPGVTIEHELVIAASPDRVWALTVDVERWPELTPTMISVERLDSGPIALGSQARVRQPRQRPAVWTVTALESGRVFRWETTVGTVRMAGAHEITPIDGGCRNQLSVHLSGFGARALQALLGRAIATAIATENAGFKRAAEEAESAQP